MTVVIEHQKERLVEQVSHLEMIAQVVGLSWRSDQFLEDIKQVHTYYGVCDVGFIALSVVLDEAELVNIAVLPDFQGKGVAKELWQYALTVFADKQIQTCYLEVRESNVRAQKFYEKQGFKRVGARKNYYRDPIEHALLYKWEKQ